MDLKFRRKFRAGEDAGTIYMEAVVKNVVVSKTTKDT